MATSTTVQETVLPRPVEPLPTPALAAATRRLADKLVDQFGMSEEAASALAVATVDPAAARRSAEAPERKPVPGGVIVAIRTEVWARYVIPDPRNPRIGPARRHPASALVGRSEATRLKPLAEPKAAPGSRPELIQRIAGQEHLAWAAQQARDYVLANNDWRESIRQQGVMTEVWIAATTFQHEDGTPDVTVPVTAEGSSRVTCVHSLLDVRSADVPYDRDERRMRNRVRKLNDTITAVGPPEAVEPDAAVAARCEKIPALLIVGFEAYEETGTDFGVAVKSLVALRHVDYPKPWGVATENESLADAVVDELERRSVITKGKAEWVAGALTPEGAETAGFSADPVVRAAVIVRLFTDRDPQAREAVRVAITSQSTRKRITTKLLLEIATSLVMRSLPEEDTKRRERIRKYLRDAFSSELAKDWQATFRDGEELSAAALAEVQKGSPDAATRELAARSAYALIVDGRLTGDRGTRNNDQPDRRNPSEIIDVMRTVPQGIYQLRQALADFRVGRRVRLVDEDGSVVRNEEGRDVLAGDVNLRATFYPPGEGPASMPAPKTPAEILGNALSGLGASVQALRWAAKQVEAVQGDDGLPAIDSLGASPADCDAWQASLFEVLQKLPLWKQHSIQRNGLIPDEDPDDDDFDDDEEVNVSDAGPDDE